MKQWFLIGVLGVSILFGGCSRINPGYVGIKVVNGGSGRGVQDFPVQVGWVFYNPVSTSVYEYPTFVQTAIWTKSAVEGKPVNEEITFTNSDQMLISADINLSYHLDPVKVPSFYVKFRSDDLSAFTHGYLRNTARDIFNEHAGGYSVAQIMGDNATFLKEVRKSLQEEMTPIGVVIDQFGIIGAPRPPLAVTEAINAKVHAGQLAQQKQNELAQVQADMAKEREKTDTYARNTLTLAEAQAQANEKLSRSITQTLVQYEALKKWNGILPTVSGSAVPFINVSPTKN